MKTSNAIRACSRAKSCAEPPTGNDFKNNLAATSGISLDSAPHTPTKLQKSLQMHAPPIQRLIRNLQPSPFHHPNHPHLRMLRKNSLLPLPHDSHAAKPTRIVHFLLVFLVKLEICETKQH
jgi:hypothetical protein